MNRADPPVGVTRRDGVAVVTLTRPESHNALGADMAVGVQAAIEGLVREPDTRVVVITGAGRSFASGADLAVIRSQSVEENLAYNERLRAMMDAVAALAVPTIAAINGFALGGGLELALACTLRVADARAQLGLPEVRLGIMPAAGGLERLPRIVGAGAAARILLTGERLTAEEAWRLGLVDIVAAEGEVLADALGLASRIAANAPLSVRTVTSLMRRAIPGQELPGRAVEDALAALLRSEDAAEGMAAFADRRDPRFVGR